ncbi:hypothetical protein EZV62_016709 [Acer yangbiense]|uniref:Uncharacterized protein n=1 Tax=Acer yangbiense TaxID=1000413 RepID=A0A5C7HP72_9ROSI|nr:hypothetical protein EZV62_016709 [Acer yangbiense]
MLQRTHFSFISCIEAEISAMQVKHSQYVETAWRKCADDLGLPQESIDNCYNSGGGTNVLFFSLKISCFFLYLKICTVGDNEFQFSFRDSIISRTHFWCKMHHDTQTKNSIDVYDDENERIKCPSTSNCYWLVDQYAFFFSQDQEYWSIVSYW